LASFDDQSDAEIRAALMASARSLMAGQGRFSLKQVLAESGIARPDFYRCFADKEALLAALVSADVQALTEIGQIAQPLQQPVALQLVQGGGSSVPAVATMPTAPPVDAWLERRLRVFERALSALETRQEKAERDLLRNVALLEEKLAAPPPQPAAPSPAPSALPPEKVIMRAATLASTMPTATLIAPSAKPAPVAEPVAVDAVFAPLPEPPVVALPQEPEAAEADMREETEEAEEAPLNETSPEEKLWEGDASDPDQETVEDQSVRAMTMEETVSGRQIEELIAQARVAAQRAAQQQAAPPRPFLPRWALWTCIGAVLVLLCAGLVLGTVARATQNRPPAAVAYRAEPHDALGRMMALADSGDAKAQTLLALAYLRGQYGAAANDAAAMRWSLAAAQQGEPVAQYTLGALYSKDDAARAVSWFEQAALRGNVKAMHNLAIAYAQGQGTAEDDSRAAAWFNRAANQGYVDSQFDLAVLFERGQGVRQNRVAALKWYLIAARGGDGPSKARADQLRAEMPAEETERAEQLVAAWHPEPRDLAANAVSSP
jgi:TPR repeat protein